MFQGGSKALEGSVGVRAQVWRLTEPEVRVCGHKAMASSDVVQARGVCDSSIKVPAVANATIWAQQPFPQCCCNVW